MKPRERHEAREYTIQAMYQWQLAQTEISEIEKKFISHHMGNKKVDLIYFKELIHAIPENANILDEKMTPFLSRPLTELDPIELAVLRLSFYELIYRLDIPFRVVINEALELTKKFGSVEGYKFVNGVLDQAAKILRADEIVTHKKKSEQNK